jgi:hypothetical protein
MLRSLVFTLLLEEPEFGRLTSDDGSRLVTDAVLRCEQDQGKFACQDCGMTTATDDLTVIGRNCSASAFERAHRMRPATTASSMRNYVNDVTDHHRCAPGIWQRYVDTLKAGDEVAARKTTEIRTPAAAVDALGETTTHEELLDFASDSTRFDGDICELF